MLLAATCQGWRQAEWDDQNLRGLQVDAAIRVGSGHCGLHECCIPRRPGADNQPAEYLPTSIFVPYNGACRNPSHVAASNVMMNVACLNMLRVAASRELAFAFTSNAQSV